MIELNEQQIKLAIIIAGVAVPIIIALLWLKMMPESPLCELEKNEMGETNGKIH
jgi:hypothetical protein